MDGWMDERSQWTAVRIGFGFFLQAVKAFIWLYDVLLTSPLSIAHYPLSSGDQIMRASQYAHHIFYGTNLCFLARIECDEKVLKG